MFFSLHLSAKEQKFVYYAHLSSTILGFFTFLAFIVFIVHMILNIVQKDKSCKLFFTQICNQHT